MIFNCEALYRRVSLQIGADSLLVLMIMGIDVFSKLAYSGCLNVSFKPCSKFKIHGVRRGSLNAGEFTHVDSSSLVGVNL